MNWVKLKENTLHYGKFLQDLNNILVLKATANTYLYIYYQGRVLTC